MKYLFLIACLLFYTAQTEAAKIVIPVFPTEDIVVVDYDVTSYGADITGVNDATTSIQNAIDACYNLGGGTVWMPAGTYKVTNTIYVKSFVTLRGDWRDPDNGSGSYGTVISAQVAPGISGPVLFQIGGSAGAMGLTVFYPNQSASSPVPYNFTFNLGAWAGQAGTYMSHSVSNCTMLNSYRGIGKCAINTAEVTECSRFRNIKGTALFNAVSAYNSSDVDTWSHINFNNSYWANAGAGYNAPSLSALNAWTRANATAYIFGDLEWDQFYDIKCSDYKVGINFVVGSRITFCGEFLYSTIVNTDIAVKADVLDNRWGVSFLRSTLSGSISSIQNNSTGYVKACDCTLTGSTSGSVQITSPGTSPASYPECSSIPKVSKSVLYDVTIAPYNAPYSVPQTGLPSLDATLAIQSALNDAGNQGGGVVYLPAGWYKINTHLVVPANVELRGCSSVAQLDENDLSYGTTLMGYEGDNTIRPETDTAMITLNGNSSGISGLRFFYPNNNPATGVKPYPFAIRGNGANLYLINLGLTGVYNAIDFTKNPCDKHFIRNVSGAIYNKGIMVGAATSGWVEDCITNPAKADRCNYGVPGWLSESNVFPQLIDPVTKVYEKHIIVNTTGTEQILNCFSYGANIGLWLQNGSMNCFNLGTDNVGIYSVRADCGNAATNIMNVMRYNGTTTSGAVTVYNKMYLSNEINPPQSNPTITSTPPLTGTAGVPYTYNITTGGAPTPGISVIGNPAWLMLNGSVLSGTPPYSGTFGPITVIASNSANCPNATQTYSIQCATDVENYDLQNEISVYPNPTNGILTVEASENIFSIEIENALGEKIYRHAFPGKSSALVDLGAYPSGIYFMKIKTQNGFLVKKIISNNQ